MPLASSVDYARRAMADYLRERYGAAWAAQFTTLLVAWRAFGLTDVCRLDGKQVLRGMVILLAAREQIESGAPDLVSLSDRVHQIEERLPS